MAPPAALARPFSLYLDCCRLLAAVLVVVSHFGPNGVTADDPERWYCALGREAVIVFFVLSGFVIAYTTEQKNHDLRAYCVARCTRIYSVALPLLLLACAAGAALLLSGQVPSERLYQLDKPWLYLPLHLLFMGELWTISETPPLLVPYWSLGYEVWYYALFGAAYYLRGKRRVIVTGSLLLLVGPKLWLLLPVWGSGVLLYHWQKTHTLARPLALAGWCASLLLLVLFKIGHLDTALRAFAIANWPFPGLPLKSADRCLADYLVCLLVLANFLCAKNMNLQGLLRIQKPIRTLASYTFTLYLLHALVMRLWLVLYPHDPSSLADVAALVVLIVLATWLVGQVTEHRKEWFEKLFTRLLLPKETAAIR